MTTKTAARNIARILMALFILQGFSACAMKGESAPENPAITESDDQLAGIKEPKPLEVAPLNPDTPQPLPVKNTVAETTPPVASAPAKVEKKETPAPTKKEMAAHVKKEKAAKATENGVFKTTSKSCMMKSKPNAKAASLTTIPKGRKIWVEKVGAFYKVSRVKGVGYLATSCF